MKQLEQGKFTLRDMYNQFQKVMGMGSMSKLMGMVCDCILDLVCFLSVVPNRLLRVDLFTDARNAGISHSQGRRSGCDAPVEEVHGMSASMSCMD